MISSKFTSEEVEILELWDCICSRIGFDEEGIEIQKAIKRFIRLREENDRTKKECKS